MNRTSRLLLAAVAAILASLWIGVPLAAADPAAGAAENPAANAAEAAERPAPLIGAPTPGGLTAERAAARAASTSHEVRAREEERKAADYGVDQARAAFIPRVTYTARYSRLSHVDQPSLGNLVAAPGAAAGPLQPGAPLAAAPLRLPVLLNQYSVDSSLEIPLSDYALRLPQLFAAAKHNERSAKLMEEASKLQVATDTRVVYYNWARARLQAEVARRALAEARAHLKDVETAAAAGTASKADVLRVTAQVAGAELSVTRAESAGDLLEQQLRVLMHDASGARYEVGEDLSAELAASSSERAQSERGLAEQAIERRLEPRALLESSGAVREQASGARAGELPRLSAVGGVTYANPNPRVFTQQDKFTATWEVGVRLTFTPTDIPGVEAGHGASLARARQLEAERDELTDSIALEVKQQLLAVHESESALSTSERRLAAAEESYRVRRVLFQNGRATSVELTDAETEWSRAQLDLIGARIDRRIAEARLVHALGEDVKDEEGNAEVAKR